MMNTRALVLGLALGFAVAATPSCGTKCSPNTCGGCCDAKGACVVKPNNANNATCGGNGAQCADCIAAGTTCDADTLTCGAGSNDGGTTVGDGGTCAGCLLPGGKVCAPGNTTNNCGLGGVACAACPVGQLCGAGTCSTPNITKVVGSSCTGDGECQNSLGAQAICKLVTSTGNGTYTGGYCTLPCKNATCPSGSSCKSIDPRYGENDVICWDDCSSGDPCRQPGYACYTVGGGSTSCWISPLPTQDAGPAADKVGIACSKDTQCQNPPDRGGVCLTRDLNRSWIDGYCSKSFCASNSECATDAGASCLTFTTNAGALSRCIQKCGISTPLDGGPADCRDGYICQTLTQADGGQSPVAFCLPPPAPPPNHTGSACVKTSDCVDPATTIADCFTETFVGADGGTQQSGFPGGYCSRFDCGLDSECAPDGGGICLLAGSSTACFQRCADAGVGQSNCRNDYVCVPYTLVLDDGGTKGSDDGYCSAPCWAPGNACTKGTCSDAGYCR